MKDKLLFKILFLLLGLGIIVVLFLVLRPKSDVAADSVFVAESTTATTVTASVTTEVTITTTATQPVETTTAASSSDTEMSDVTTAPVVTTKPATTTTAPVTTAKPTGTQVKSFTLNDGQVLKNLVFPETKPDMSNDWVMANREMFLSEWGYLRSVGIIDNATGIPIKDPFGMPMTVYFPTETDEINFMTWAKTECGYPVDYWVNGYLDPSLVACAGWDFAFENSGKCLPYTAYDQYGNYFGPEVFQQTVNHTRS